MEKRISIVIPTYNSIHTLRQCLDSVFKVKYSNFEVILVNDCSTDNSEEIAKSYPCRILRLLERRGPGFARDKGVAIAGGEVIAFLDSDCIVPEDWLNKINNKINSNIVGLGGKYDLPEDLNTFSKILLMYLAPNNIFYNKPREIISFSGGNCAIWKSSLMRIREKKELHFFNGMAGGEDTVMCCELHKFGRLIFDPDLTVLHNKRDSPLNILKSAVRYGYTGMIVSSICGSMVVKDFYRWYKTIVYLFSVLLFFLILFLPLSVVKPIFYYFFIAYLIIQLPIFIFTYKRLSIRLPLMFTPIGVFLVDLAHFLGHIKRFFAIISDILRSSIWCIKFIFNIMSRHNLSKLFFFVTKECNANCYYCFNKENAQMYLAGDDLSLEEIDKIIGSIHFLPLLTITGGEPFLRCDIYDICKRFYLDCGTRIITIVTNGILSSHIDDTVEKLLIDCPHLKLTIIVALDEVGENHDLIKDRKGCYKQALQTLERLNILKFRFPRLIIGINTMVLYENTGNMNYILDYFSDNIRYDRQSLNLYRQIACTSNMPGTLPIDDFFDMVKMVNLKIDRKLSGFKQKLYQIFLEYCQETAVKEFRNKKPSSVCLAAQKFLVINNTGDVYPCELLMNKLDGLREKNYDLRKIIKGQLAKSIMAEIKDSKCYCQWPCAAVCNTIFRISSHYKILKRLILAGTENNGPFLSDEPVKKNQISKIKE